MKSLRDQLDAAIDSYDMHGDPERLAMDAARAALEKAFDTDAFPSVGHADDIDALLEE